MFGLSLSVKYVCGYLPNLIKCFIIITMKRNIVKLQGLPVDTFAFDDALDFALKSSGQIITINPEMIMYAQKHTDFAKIIEDADLIIPDSIGIEIGLKILRCKVHRIAGIEFAKELVRNFTKKNKTIALLGAKPEVIQKTVENLRIEFPDIKIVFIKDGYFEDEQKVLNEITALKPDLLLTALGSPKQEIFNKQIKTVLPQTLSIGVGGSFDVWSGIVKRAPFIWQKLGLEWLYRTIKEPERCKRIFPALPLFIMSVISERLLSRKVCHA